MMSKRQLGLAAILLGLCATVLADPSSNVAFTTEVRNMVAEGDVEAGKQKAATCTGCHGQKGVASNPSYPSLAGQNPNYTYKQLRDYKDGSRKSSLMRGLVQGLSKQDMANIAAYYASLDLPPPKEAQGDLSKAEHLAKRGDGERMVPACQACHNSGKGQQVAVPGLSGQNAQYTAKTLRAYKEGSRDNDIYSVMGKIAEALTSEEIKQLADYYAGLAH